MKKRSEQALSFFPESPSKAIPLDFEEEDDHLDVEGFSECHPMFGAYMSVIEMIFLLSSMLYGLPILKKHHKRIRKLDKTYKVGSPHGPILDSYFNMWEFFDAEIEESGETLGDIIIKLGKNLEIDQEKLHLINLLKESINSVYIVENLQEDKAFLRSIVTEKTYYASILKEIPLEIGGRYLIRLLPSEENEFISLTTPYALKASEKEWKTFFEKQPIKTKGAFDLEKYRQFMKRGPSFDYWLEYLKTAAADPYSLPITLEGVPP